VLTRSDRTDVYRLRLPSTTLFSSAFAYRALVSHNTLLRHGYKVDLAVDHCVILTPNGDVIRLEVRDGLYYFPAPVSISTAAPASSVRQSSRLQQKRPAPVHSSPPAAPIPGEPGPVSSSSSPLDPALNAGELADPTPNSAGPSPCESQPHLTPGLLLNLDCWDGIHCTYGHPDRNCMLKIALAMDPADPHRPKLNTLTKWMMYRPCPFCVTGAMRRPPANKAHPPLPRRPDIDNGEGLHIDCLGTFPGPAIGGYTNAFLFTDDHSSIRVAFPTHSKSCVSLLEHVKTYVAASQVSLKFIRTDNEFMCEPLLSWCRDNKIQLSACAPHTHVQNPKAERSVGRVKETMRKDKHQAATLDYLLPYAYMHACQSLNCQPTSADPTGSYQSPLCIWPTAPFQHEAQSIHPWGCCAFGFIGK